jgi:hypothetical protein
VAQGIVHQGADGLAQPVRVRLDYQALAALDRQPDGTGSGPRFEAGSD